MLRMIAITVTACTLAGAGRAAEDRSRLTGRWEFNRTESDFGPGNAHKPRKLTLKITEEKDTVQIVWSGVDPEGKADEAGLTFTVDGQDHPSTAPANTGIQTYNARWEGGTLVVDKVASSWTEKDVFTVSDDGKRLTLNRTHHNAYGDSTLKFVYDRIK